MRHPRTAALATCLSAAVAVSITGCSADVTAHGLQRTFQQSFARLYVLQQADLGRPNIKVGSFYSTASCLKGAPNSPQTGSGDNWVCIEQWQQFDGHVSEAAYDVTVRTDGCFTAAGPVGVIGNPDLIGPDGGSFVNPLSQVDACLEA